MEKTIKMSFLVDKMIIYQESLKEPMAKTIRTKNLLGLSYKITNIKSIVFYTPSELRTGNG